MKYACKNKDFVMIIRSALIKPKHINKQKKIEKKSKDQNPLALPALHNDQDQHRI